MASQSRFVSGNNQDSYPNSVFSAHGEVDVRKRKIFVFRKTILLPATKGPGKQIRRILIFDDHPDSLRLILERPANRQVHRTAQNRGSSRHLVLLGMVLIAASLAMFWPLL